MKLYGIRVFIDDFAAARRFYVDVLGLTVVWEMPEHGALGIDVGGPQLIVEVIPPDSEDRSLVGRFVGVSLQVDDIQATHARLVDRGVAFTSPPERQFWGGWLAHFQDPAGNTLTLLG